MAYIWEYLKPYQKEEKSERAPAAFMELVIPGDHQAPRLICHWLELKVPTKVKLKFSYFDFVNEPRHFEVEQSKIWV